MVLHFLLAVPFVYSQLFAPTYLCNLMKLMLPIHLDPIPRLTVGSFSRSVSSTCSPRSHLRLNPVPSHPQMVFRYCVSLHSRLFFFKLTTEQKWLSQRFTWLLIVCYHDCSALSAAIPAKNWLQNLSNRPTPTIEHVILAQPVSSCREARCRTILRKYRILSSSIRAALLFLTFPDFSGLCHNPLVAKQSTTHLVYFRLLFLLLELPCRAVEDDEYVDVPASYWSAVDAISVRIVSTSEELPRSFLLELPDLPELPYLLLRPRGLCRDGAIVCLYAGYLVCCVRDLWRLMHGYPIG